MKYIITGSEYEPTVILGNRNHETLAESVCGKYRKPCSAGHFKIVNGKVEVYGGSIGYDIDAKPEDAEIIQHELGL